MKVTPLRASMYILLLRDDDKWHLSFLVLHQAHKRVFKSVYRGSLDQVYEFSKREIQNYLSELEKLTLYCNDTCEQFAISIASLAYKAQSKINLVDNGFIAFLK